MRIKLHGYSLYFPVLVLWAIESMVMLVACRLAYRLIQGPTKTLLETVTQATVLAACIVLAAVGMGLYSRRQRDRLGGVLLRVTLCVLVGAVGAKALLMFTPQFSTHPLKLLQVSAVAWLVMARFASQLPAAGQGPVPPPRAGLWRRRQCRADHAAATPLGPARLPPAGLRAGRRRADRRAAGRA